MSLTTPQAVATQVLLAYWGRPSDIGTLQQYANGFVTVQGILQPTLAQQKALFASIEAINIFGSGATVDTVITKAFGLVGRTPTASDLAAWKSWISSVAMDIAQIPWEVMKVALTTESQLAAEKQIAWTRLAVSYQLAEDITSHPNLINALASDPQAGSQLHALVETVTAPNTIAPLYPATGEGTAAAFVKSRDSTFPEPPSVPKGLLPFDAHGDITNEIVTMDFAAMSLPAIETVGVPDLFALS